MYSSIATVCLSGQLPEKLQAIADAGFTGVEIFENDLTAFNGSAREAGQMIRDLGLKLVTLQPFRDFEGLEGTLRQKAFDRAEKKFDLMAELGTDLLMVCSSIHPAAQPGLSRICDDFAELGERAAARNMRVAFEALAWGRHIHDYRDTWEVVRRVNQDSVGLVLDTFHIFSRQSDLGMIPSIPGDRIFLVQTADAPKLSMDQLSWSRHYRCFPGQGELQIQTFMQALKTTRYDGPLSHEIFNDVFRMGDARQTALDGMRSYNLLQAMVCDEKTLPGRSEVEQIEFIECATNEQHIEELRNIMRALGLKKAGHHQQKKVERWAVNGVNFLLNYDQHNLHDRLIENTGIHICAYAIRTPNAYNTLKRARMLGYEVVAPDPVRDSHGMSYIRSINGAQLYVVDESIASFIWDTEFNEAAEPPTAGPVIHVDHLSKSLSYQDYLTLMLQYRSIFNLQPTASFDVADPKGLIQSQVLHHEGGVFRLALNASFSPESSSNQFVKARKGAGVQHLALQTRDIFASARCLLEHQMESLPIPENYYRDLDARFDLSSEQLDLMQQFNVLYDEDENGCFWHLYTKTPNSNFFFELVQRDGYQGLGASNAFIRVSAQRNVSDQ
ncbi:bifunctional sugar phosphate isomerase/epimerase/4-hydroxyphenylpyruvate dioxygenase family protein [Gynuella sunshinyii]|uniref:3-dehydroshikimate dehydratase n=1 Tax=Gynuella sunshinyii YC6258 TaxID=1445510 RepID=A0A0C5VHL4_9GAMM|nr:sugar phosphate isomerase/epimerase and 4-hydroxyphenylpyruvate domain-containing protein [Gynuella sunshinyii]AJQ93736.1 4-hydroxyphenylpyruvate dioxygenase-related hemolysin [Gynuella sunshinyii YC6258]